MMRPFLILFIACAVRMSSVAAADGVEVPLDRVGDDTIVLALDEHDQLLDFVRIPPDSDIERIEFAAPESGEELRVALIGTNLHPSFADRKVHVSSKVAEGYRGSVAVRVEEGIVTNLEGNTLYSDGPPIPEVALARLMEKLADPDYRHLPMTRIVKVDRYRTALVEDDHGNLIPQEPSEKEQQFIDVVRPALEAGDVDALNALTHTTDDEPFFLAGTFLQPHLRRGEFRRFLFHELDEAHPDSQELLERNYIMRPRWRLTIVIRDPEVTEQFGVEADVTVDLAVAEHEGRLKFPTISAKVSEP